MRTLRALVVLALLLATSAARAGTMNLRWSACFGDGGTVNRAFACDTNLGSEQLLATFILSAPVDSVQQLVGIVRFAFAGTTIPTWWEFGSGGQCRSSSLATSVNLPAGSISGIDYADGARDTQYLYQPGFAFNTTQLVVYSPFIPQGVFDLVAGQEYLAFTVVINHQRTVGAGACGGCSVGVCMAFGNMQLMRASTRNNEV